MLTLVFDNNQWSNVSATVGDYCTTEWEVLGGLRPAAVHNLLSNVRRVFLRLFASL